MSHKVFENYNKLSPTAFSGFAGELGLDTAAFDECLASGKYDDMIQAKVNEAKKAGISSTPNFLVGYTQEGSTKFKAAELIKGAYPYANFEEVVNKLIKEKESGD